MNPQIINYTPRNHGLVTGAHGPGNLSGQRCTTETPSRSRAGRPLGRDSASLEGHARPRASLHLARGSRGSAAPAPIPPTGALNALTWSGCPGQRRIPATPTL
jgi:hypothetical protein